MAVEQVQVLEEGGVLCNLHRAHVLPRFCAGEVARLAVLEHLVHLHQPVALVEVVVEVDEHVAAGHVLRVLQLHSDEHGAHQRSSQGEDAHSCLLAGAKGHHHHDAKHYQKDDGEH